VENPGERADDLSGVLVPRYCVERVRVNRVEAGGRARKD